VETLKRLLEAPIPLIDRVYQEKLAQEKALSLTIPETLLATADEVIQ
jgi:hypothetical protein